MELFPEYFHKDHVLSRMDARVKLVVTLLVLIMVLSYRGFTFPLFVLLLTFLTCLKLRIPWKAFVLRFSEPLFIAVVLVMLKFFFSGNNTLFTWSLFGIKISGQLDGLMEGLLIASRMLGAIAIVTLLVFSTPFTELMAALSWLRIPKQFIEILLFAYRYIFVFLDEAMVIYHAQKNRLGYSSLRRSFSSFGILAGSLILKAFDHSQNTTIAMVQRGYDGHIPMLKNRPFKPSEILISFVFLIALGFLWKI